MGGESDRSMRYVSLYLKAYHAHFMLIYAFAFSASIFGLVTRDVAIFITGFLLIASVTGLLGTIKKSRTLLWFSLLTMVALVTGEIVMGHLMRTLLHDQGGRIDRTDPFYLYLRDIWRDATPDTQRNIQSWGQCCGFADYSTLVKPCVRYKEEVGCLGAMLQSYQKASPIITGIGFTVVAFQVLGLVLVCFLIYVIPNTFTRRRMSVDRRSDVLDDNDLDVRDAAYNIKYKKQMLIGTKDATRKSNPYCMNAYSQEDPFYATEDPTTAVRDMNPTSYTDDPGTEQMMEQTIQPCSYIGDQDFLNQQNPFFYASPQMASMSMNQYEQYGQYEENAYDDAQQTVDYSTYSNWDYAHSDDGTDLSAVQHDPGAQESALDGESPFDAAHCHGMPDHEEYENLEMEAAHGHGPPEDCTQDMTMVSENGMVSIMDDPAMQVTSMQGSHDRAHRPLTEPSLPPFPVSKGNQNPIPYKVRSAKKYASDTL